MSEQDFEQRALECIEHLTRDAAVLRTVLGDYCPLVHDLVAAKRLLDEAVQHRKAKDSTGYVMRVTTGT